MAPAWVHTLAGAQYRMPPHIARSDITHLASPSGQQVPTAELKGYQAQGWRACGAVQAGVLRDGGRPSNGEWGGPICAQGAHLYCRRICR